MHDKPVALVTGANQGIGLQIAKELAAKSFTVLVGSRDFARGREAANTIHGDARALQLDVTDRASIAAAAKAHSRRVVGLTCSSTMRPSRTRRRNPKVNGEHAGATRASNVSLDEVRAIWETNVLEPSLFTRRMLLPMRECAFQARIVNVSSGAGLLTRNADPANPTAWYSAPATLGVFRRRPQTP